MEHTEARLLLDIESIKQISIVPNMLEVICRSTGMGFAAIARVTQDRWIACSVRDEILFGLEEGGELEIETTICNDIREVKKAVIIDEVDKSEIYCNHPTPKLYGFQSYISVPIILKSGEFFGTLCAIDPKPALLNNAKTIGMFNLFSELISFHLQSVQLIERSNNAVLDLNRQLTDSIDENRQYQFISNHNLQEPLRKIRIFSSMLVNAAEKKDTDKAKEIALKINSNAQRFSMMIKDLSDFSELNHKDFSFEIVDLNDIVADVRMQLKAELTAKNAEIHVEKLPSIYAISLQMEQLFYHLISNALRFSKHDISPVIHIRSFETSINSSINKVQLGIDTRFVEIRLQDNGIGIEQSQLESIFDIFSRLPYDNVLEGRGTGLAYCRKIIRNHNGNIKAQSEPGIGTTFCINLPINPKEIRM